MWLNLVSMCVCLAGALYQFSIWYCWRSVPSVSGMKRTFAFGLLCLALGAVNGYIFYSRWRGT